MTQVPALPRHYAVLCCNPLSISFPGDSDCSNSSNWQLSAPHTSVHFYLFCLLSDFDAGIMNAMRYDECNFAGAVQQRHDPSDMPACTTSCSHTAGERPRVLRQAVQPCWQVIANTLIDTQ